MRLFDTHCHFESDDREAIATALRRAKAAGVEALMAVGGSSELNRNAVLAVSIAAESGPDMPKVLLSLGYDRDQCEAASLPSVRESFDSPIAAVGEIGLDYHYSPETRKSQLRLFAAQLEEAKTLDKPVVIHTREADDDTLALLREIPSRGIIHCFTGSPAFAAKLLELGFMISFSGIATFKSAENVRAAVAVVPDDRILIETDAPFLAPEPMRGNRNEPAFVAYTCRFLAGFRGIAEDDFAELTFANARRALGC